MMLRARCVVKERILDIFNIFDVIFVMFHRGKKNIYSVGSIHSTQRTHFNFQLRGHKKRDGFAWSSH